MVATAVLLRAKGEQPIERLMKLANDPDRSVNYLVVQAIMEFLEREEGKQ